MKVLSSLSYSHRLARTERVNAVSMTVPDMALSIHEIISRFTRGQTVPTRLGSNVDGDFSDFDNLSVFEQIDLARKTNKEVYDLRDKVNAEYRERKLTKQQKEIQKRIDAEVAKRLQTDGDKTLVH